MVGTKNHSIGKTRQNLGRFLVRVSFAVLLFALLYPAFLSGAELAEGMAKCSGIDDPTSRLQCFDALTEKAGGPATPSKIVARQAQREAADRSVLSKQWDLEEAAPKDTLRIRPYRANYFLPFSYNTTPNRSEALDVDRNARAQHIEAEFQLSLKMKIWQDLFGKDMDLWFAYTQHSFWQLYNTAFSSPFRDTNYEPELFLTLRTDYPLLGLRGRFFNIGLDHQSNGRSEPLSRSWNRVVATAGFERGGLNLFLKTWYRIPESALDDDNPDIDRYAGYGELSALYYWKGHRFGALFRNNLRINDSKGAIQLDWAFPLPFMQMQHFKGYIQYFNGYYDNLLDYNKSTNRIGFGLMLADW
jgi:phospholipase A1